jgi:uncharacterized membrane protein
MNKRIRWLRGEIDRWVKEGLIEDHHAQAIRKSYPASNDGLSWGSMTFGVTGSVLIGLGVILFFAFNWNGMHKFTKLGVIFATLIASHGVALVLNRKSLSETLHILGTMIFGSGIWLIAQIYHIEEHFPNGILIWGLAALSLAMILPSIPQALLAAFLLLVWQGFETILFRNTLYLAPALIFAGTLPLALYLRSRVLTGAGLVAFLVSLSFVFAARYSFLNPPLYVSLGAAFVASGMLLERSERSSGLAPVFFFFGMFLSYFILFLLTFSFISRDLYRPFSSSQLGYWYLAISASAVGLWIAALRPFKTLKERIAASHRFDYLIVPAVLVFTLLIGLHVVKTGGALPGLGYNLLYLASVVLIMVRGFRTDRPRLAVVGCLLLAAYSLARYVDLFQSLLARSAVFVIMGASIITVGYYFASSRKARQEAE